MLVGRTVVIIAHRLSTVRNADQVIVIENGTVAEKGMSVWSVCAIPNLGTTSAVRARAGRRLSDVVHPRERKRR